MRLAPDNLPFSTKSQKVDKRAGSYQHPVIIFLSAALNFLVRQLTLMAGIWHYTLTPDILPTKLTYDRHRVTPDTRHLPPTADTRHRVSVSAEPDKEYRVWLRAFTGAGPGKPSQTVRRHTDVSGPGPPHITDMSCPADTALRLRWRRPNTFYRSVHALPVSVRLIPVSTPATGPVHLVTLSTSSYSTGHNFCRSVPTSPTGQYIFCRSVGQQFKYVSHWMG